MSDVPLPVFAPDEKVCGNCKLWYPHSTDARGWVGPCRLQSNRGLFPPSAPICNAFVAKGGVTVAPPASVQRSRPVRSVAPVVRRRDGTQNVELGDLNMTRDELIDLFREAAGDPEAPPIAAKWEGGTVRIVPGNPELQSKDLPVDALFHKVVMVRDRLRTLEQKINAHPKLTDAEKVEMQHYITRVYGSLTTFNVLFREKNDQFVGAKGDE
jgi:hypothetical protein